jgi:hypothetical protein
MEHARDLVIEISDLGHIVMRRIALNCGPTSSKDPAEVGEAIAFVGFVIDPDGDLAVEAFVRQAHGVPGEPPKLSARTKYRARRKNP